MILIKGTIQPGLRLVLSGNFFLAFNRSHYFLFKKSQNLIMQLELNDSILIILHCWKILRIDIKWWLLFKAKKKFPAGTSLRPGWIVPLILIDETDNICPTQTNFWLLVFGKWLHMAKSRKIFLIWSQFQKGTRKKWLSQLSCYVEK